jgi:AbrB family looped-hinge helix DNA binding protein
MAAKLQICRFRAYNGGMETYTARLEKSGRILIPAAVRRHLGLSEGSQVIVRVGESGTLQVSSRSQALAKARREIRKYIPAGRDLAEELIRDRRAEAEREDQGDSRR